MERTTETLEETAAKIVPKDAVAGLVLTAWFDIKGKLHTACGLNGPKIKPSEVIGMVALATKTLFDAFERLAEQIEAQNGKPGFAATMHAGLEREMMLRYAHGAETTVRSAISIREPR